MTYFDFSESQIAVLAQADCARAIAEDVGEGDLTAALIEPSRRVKARILAREAAVICGTPWVNAAVHQLDPHASIRYHVAEGSVCQTNQIILEIEGNAQALLTAERTALNFLQLLSGVATKTATFVRAIADIPNNRAKIVDTRKTIPGLRLAQKYAVRTGGGTNHRIGLFDAILIKENHIAAAGGVSTALQRAQVAAKNAKFIEIEVETLEQLREALDHGATMVLLDNMNLAQMQEAVTINQGRAILEVSGGVNLATVRDIAATGVDRISIGGLTKDVQAIDFSMRFEDL